MMKRHSPGSDEDDANEEVCKKQRLISFDPIRIPAVSSTHEIDSKVLHVQHVKLSERFRHKERQINQFQKRVEELERRQIQDDAMLCIINRSWNKFDDIVRILLERFDTETSVEGEIIKESEETKNFLANLAHWENDELEDRLKQRVEFSRRTVAKLVQIFDRVTQRNEKIAELISICPKLKEADEGASTSMECTDSRSTINKTVASLNKELSSENSRLQKIVTKLQAENSSFAEKVHTLEDELTLMKTRTEETSNKLEEVRYELNKAICRESRLDFRLAEYVRKLQEMELNGTKITANCVAVENSSISSTTNVSKNKLEELKQDLENQAELAAARLQETQELVEKNKELNRQVENLKLSLKHIPPETIKSSVDYITLQSQFSIIYMEATQLKQQLEIARNQISSLTSAHAHQIEVMESEECQAREQMQDTMNRHEEELYQVRNEYEMLRLEFEQNLSANEQSGPLNKEIRLMLASAKAEIQQLKQESNRFRRKWKEAVSSLAKCNKELDMERKFRERCLMIDTEDESCTLSSPDVESSSLELIMDGCSHKPNDLIDGQNEGGSNSKEKIQKMEKKISELQVKINALNSLSVDQRDRLEIISKEQTLKIENERLKAHLQKCFKADMKDKMKYYNEEAQRRIKNLEEMNERLRKEANSAKQEEEGLMNDVETTGQAFEEMQEQNMRLLQQLREKDEANMNLMSERIRANQYQKKMSEERERTEERLNSLQNQLEAQQLMITKLEDKDKLLSQKNSHMENQIRLLEQTVDFHKRKAIECAQSSADYKVQLEKCSSQLNDVQQALITKTTQQEADIYKIRRLEEDKTLLKKKLERAKKIEKMGTMEEVLNEEIRELKDSLTCPSCKVRRKDAILTKCFHVFCMECLKTRYETRRRKCPKCNAGFGANDYRRIYFT